MSEQLETKDKNNKVTKQAPIDLFEDANKGMEHADRHSYAIPFVVVLQGLSPQLETIEGAKPGMFYNTITNRVSKELLVIPCAFKRRFIAWAPRDEGGGYKGEYNPIDIELGKVNVIRDEDGRIWLAGGYELKDTRNHYCLVYNESKEMWGPALISLASTQVKKSKRWMSRISSVELRNKNGKAYNPPSFSHIYLCKSVKEENAQGAWWGWDISIKSGVCADFSAPTAAETELYMKAKALNEAVNKDEVEVAAPPAGVNEEPTAQPGGKF